MRKMRTCPQSRKDKKICRSGRVWEVWQGEEKRESSEVWADQNRGGHEERKNSHGLDWVSEGINESMPQDRGSLPLLDASSGFRTSGRMLLHWYLIFSSCTPAGFPAGPLVSSPWIFVLNLALTR